MITTPATHNCIVWHDCTHCGAGDCTWEAYRGEWTECTHEDLLADTITPDAHITIWETNSQSCAGVVVSFNVGLHAIQFGEVSEIHDLLDLTNKKKWVLDEFKNSELFNKKVNVVQ